MLPKFNMELLENGHPKGIVDSELGKFIIFQVPAVKLWDCSCVVFGELFC